MRKASIATAALLAVVLATGPAMAQSGAATAGNSGSAAAQPDSGVTAPATGRVNDPPGILKGNAGEAKPATTGGEGVVNRSTNPASSAANDAAHAPVTSSDSIRAQHPHYDLTGAHKDHDARDSQDTAGTASPNGAVNR